MTITIKKQDANWIVESPNFFSGNNDVIIRTFENEDEAKKHANGCIMLAFASERG